MKKETVEFICLSQGIFIPIAIICLLANPIFLVFLAFAEGVYYLQAYLDTKVES